MIKYQCKTRAFQTTDVLSRGRHYKLNVEVTNTATKQTASLNHNIYVLQTLRRCRLVARDVTEFTEVEVICLLLSF